MNARLASPPLGQRHDAGMVLMVAMFTLIIGILVAGVSFFSSQQTSVQVRNEGGKMSARYVAEAAIQKTLSKIEARVAADTWYYDPTDLNLVSRCISSDPTAVCAAQDPTTYCPNKDCLLQVYNPATDTDLVDCEKKYTWTAADHTDAALIKAAEFGDTTASEEDKVICDFLATDTPDEWCATCAYDVRVSVVRHANYLDGVTGQLAGVYKASVIARTADKRRHVMQAVFLLPLTYTAVGANTVQDPSATIFLASSVNYN